MPRSSAGNRPESSPLGTTEIDHRQLQARRERRWIGRVGQRAVAVKGKDLAARTKTESQARTQRHDRLPLEPLHRTLTLDGKWVVGPLIATSHEQKGD